MTGIGENIKKLRKAKGLTQDELAGVIGISGQAVSKWENGGSPDLEMLPALATTFGITIDELMGFKLNAYTNKDKFIRLMSDAGVLKRGNFEIKGVKREFFIDSEKFTTNIHLAKLGEFFADRIMEEHIDCDCIVGLAYHGISFSSATAIALANKYAVTVNYCHDRMQPDSKGSYICGHIPEDGERIVLVDDLVGSGKTLEERIERLREVADIKVSAIVAIVDSYETGMEEPLNGSKKLAEKYGAKILTIVNGDDILHAIENGIIG
jgi:orotate phosphoribosyltransferase